MTATPIPRTLAMTLYGDLDVSVIDELPPGRKPVITRHCFDSRMPSLYDGIRQQIRQGRQVYIVFPLIEESESIDLKNLEDGFSVLTQVFPEFRLSKVHGKMKPADKEAEMQRFVSGETQIFRVQIFVLSLLFRFFRFFLRSLFTGLFLRFLCRFFFCQLFFGKLFFFYVFFSCPVHLLIRHHCVLPLYRYFLSARTSG